MPISWGREGKFCSRCPKIAFAVHRGLIFAARWLLSHLVGSGPNTLFLKLLAGLYLWHTFLLARYGELEKEAEDLGVAKEPDVIELLNKLYPFAIDDITTLPYVQVRSKLNSAKNGAGCA